MSSSFNQRIFEALYDDPNIEGGIQKALKMIGEQFSVSRVYIFENSKDGLCASNTFEWCAPGIEPQIEHLQDLSYEEYGYKDLFDGNGLFFSSNIYELEPIQRELFESQGICATIQFAMYDKSVFRGFIGFDDCVSVRPDWAQDGDTMDTLVFLSKLMAVYLLKERNLQDAVAYHEQLERALDAATEASRAKSEFLSRMSHDIRTPLNGIIGITEIALTEVRDAQTRSNLEMIASSSHFLLSLINDILDISRIESGKMELHPAPFSVTAFNRMIDSVIRPLMREKDIHFEYQMNCGLQCARIDELRFNQIFFNLLSNAAKFTPNGGHVVFSAVKLSSNETTEWVRFSVKDNGIGMTQEFICRAFEPFEQMFDHGFSGQQHQGAGLGLAIVRELTRLMGGSVSVNSELGKGSEFIVDIPLEKCEPPQHNKTHGTDAEKMDLTGVQVLLAEDNEINAFVATRLLESKGIVVVCAANGAKALERFMGSAPGEFSAILMDVRMPEMDGLEATRRLRRLPRADASDIPIIAMTANTFESDVSNCIEAGMNAHLSKPIEPNKLFDVLYHWIADKQ